MRAAARVLRPPAVAILGAVLAGCPAPPEPGDPLAGLTVDQRTQFDAGRAVFDSAFEAATGLGPLFNGVSCAACHAHPVPGGAGAVTEVHATALAEDGFCDPLAELGGLVFQQQATDALQEALGLDREPIPHAATDTAMRSTPDVFGFGLLDAVPDSTILALADPEDADGDGISGRVNRFFDGRLGRFGRKALVPTLDEFNEGAFQIEQGVTSPRVLDEGTVGGEPIPDGVDPLPEPELDSASVAATNAFVRLLAPPAPRPLDREAHRGERLFGEIGCASCHVPALRTGDHPVAAVAHREVKAYTDLLLHDMGPELADICLSRATPSEFRTEPLMGLRLMNRFLHDGRASTVEEAILLHGGEAAASRSAFEALPGEDRSAVLAFLSRL